MAMPCRLHGDILLLLLGAVAVAVAHPAANEFCAAVGGGSGGCGVGGGGGGGDGRRILIRGGTVVNAHRVEEADVYVEDGVIVAVRPNIPVSVAADL
jgi:dihydropyrimidinase